MRVVFESREAAAHEVRDNRSPMQVPVGCAALGEAIPMTSRPAQQKTSRYLPSGGI